MSEKTGLSRNAWQTYELGKSTPGTPVYQALLGMGISANWLISGIGNMTATCGKGLSGYSFLPLFAAVGSMGDGGCCSDEIVDWLAFADDWLRLELRAKASDLAVIVSHGDSMLPTICPGEILIVNHAKRTLQGDGIYVLNVNGNCMVKRLQIMIDGSVQIVSDNPAYSAQVVRNGDLDALAISGRVVWHGRRV